MIITHTVCINARMVEVIGLVVGETGNSYIVDFEHNGISYRGFWPKVC